MKSVLCIFINIIMKRAEKLRDKKWQEALVFQQGKLITAHNLKLRLKRKGRVSIPLGCLCISMANLSCQLYIVFQKIILNNVHYLQGRIIMDPGQ